MTLSNEGVRIVVTIALIAVCILVTAFFRTLVGRDKNRNFVMSLGTLGGIAFGVLIASPLSGWIGKDVSSLSAVGGMFLGWAIAYRSIRKMPYRTV